MFMIWHRNKVHPFRNKFYRQRAKNASPLNCRKLAFCCFNTNYNPEKNLNLVINTPNRVK